MVTPTTSRSAATRWISNHTDGNSICRCGSLARIGRPALVRRFARTQLLLFARRADADSHSKPAGSLRAGGDSGNCAAIAIGGGPAIEVVVGIAGGRGPLRIAGALAG